MKETILFELTQHLFIRIDHNVYPHLFSTGEAEQKEQLQDVEDQDVS